MWMKTRVGFAYGFVLVRGWAMSRGSQWHANDVWAGRGRWRWQRRQHYPKSWFLSGFFCPQFKNWDVARNSWFCFSLFQVFDTSFSIINIFDTWWHINVCLGFSLRILSVSFCQVFDIGFAIFSIFDISWSSMIIPSSTIVSRKKIKYGQSNKIFVRLFSPEIWFSH